jgi:hypothetical protein
MIVQRGVSPELRRIGVGIAGFAVLGLGLALLFVPVPGTSILVIPFGLGILAKEFAWARRLLAWATGAIRRGWARLRALRWEPSSTSRSSPLARRGVLATLPSSR